MLFVYNNIPSAPKNRHSLGENIDLFHNKRHPKEMGVPEIRQFITHLVAEKKVSASTQNQALSAILFLYRHVLHIQLDESSLVECRPEKSKTVPVVLSKEEARAVISNLTGVYKIVTQIMYGGGLRVMEALRLPRSVYCLTIKYAAIISSAAPITRHPSIERTATPNRPKWSTTMPTVNCPMIIKTTAVVAPSRGSV